MNEAQFLERWRSEKPIYEAWADFISQSIHKELEPIIAPISLDYFIKIPVSYRLKADSGLVDKAFYRQKNYKNPYEDITDKVGMRFVVLLTTDIKKICDVIQNARSLCWWEASKDRDYEQERLEKPLEFSYQSVHFILRSQEGIEHNGVKIPKGTPCEVQIRTLLQHAHSELTHDTLYKPKTTAKPEVKRTVAKSMALIEATDEFFEQAIRNIDEAARSQREILAFLSETYEAGTGQKAGTERSNLLLIDTYLDKLPVHPFAEIRDFLASKTFIFDKIKEQIGVRHFFSQPVVLAAYYLVSSQPASTEESWPMEKTDLAKIFSDLGKKFDDPT